MTKVWHFYKKARETEIMMMSVLSSLELKIVAAQHAVGRRSMQAGDIAFCTKVRGADGV